MVYSYRMQSVAIETVRPLVEEQIGLVLHDRIEQAGQIHQNYANFWRAIEKIVMAGGKRLRPYLTVVGYGKIDSEIIKVASAQELIHIAMLIHDDIIDKDTIRHGQKNISGLYRETYAPHVSAEEAAHFADSAAILAGDALISEAYQLLQSTEFSKDIKSSIFRQFGTSIYEVMAGELMDVEAAFVKGTVFDPLSIYRYKTASYSLVGPLLSGAYCAKHSSQTISALKKFAISAGIMYQIQDDLLGVYGDESATGKSTTGDLKEGKRTLLVTIHESLMDSEQTKRFQNFFGNPQASDAQFAMLKNDMIESGAKLETQGYVKTYCHDALKQLEDLAGLPQQHSLKNLVESISGRRA